MIVSKRSTSIDKNTNYLYSCTVIFHNYQSTIKKKEKKMNGIFIRIDEFLKGSTVTNLSGIRLIFNDSLLFTEECLE